MGSKEDTAIVGDAKLNIMTKYRDGQMLLKVKAYPYKGTIEKSLNRKGSDPTVSLIFQDEDDFEITTFEFKLDQMLHVGDQHLELNLTREISEKKYDLIKAYKTGHYGFVE